MGISLINFYAKTKKTHKKKKKARLIYMECLVPAGKQLSLGKGKLKPHLHMLVICRASFEEECHITMPLFPVIGLGGESALQFLWWFVLFSLFQDSFFFF